MKELIQEWIKEAEKDLSDNRGNQWAFLEFKMGLFCRDFGAKLKKARPFLKQYLEKELKVLGEQIDNESKLRNQSLKTELDNIIEYEIGGSMLRSLCAEYEEGEK